MIRRLHHLLREYSPVPLLVFGTGMLYIFVSREFWSVAGPIAGIVVGSLVGLVAILYTKVRRDASEMTNIKRSPLDPRLSVVGTSAFVAAMVILFRVYTHHRPVLLYVLFAGYAGFIAYQIARGGKHVSIVPQIITLAFFTYWSSQWLFPAGMAGPDTLLGYIRGTVHIYETGTILARHTIYAGHLGYAAEFSMITGLGPKTGYFLLATLLLVITIPIISILHRALPALSTEICLYAALIFAVSSWMIGRGMHPNKLNFFYPLVLLLGISTIQLYRSVSQPRSTVVRWSMIGVMITPAIVFGHRFSAGAGMIFLLVIGGFTLFSIVSSPVDYDVRPRQSVFLFVGVYVLAVMGNPLHQGSLLSRLSDTLLAVVQSESSSGGAGRYSEFAIDVLVASTTAQTLLFGITVLGAIWLFRQREWEYDIVIAWMGFLAVFLFISLTQNSADTAPQRFYSYVVLFGFNVCTGGAFYVLGRRDTLSRLNLPESTGRVLVAALVIMLAVTSLVSPVADKATSPVADKIPHFRQFETEARIAGGQWQQEYAPDTRRIVAPTSDVPIERTSATTGTANISVLSQEQTYAYSTLTNRTGVVAGDGLTLGGRVFVFVPPPEQPGDSKVYTNGETTVFTR